MCGGTQNGLLEMSGFRVNGASLSMHQDLQWEAADPSVPLQDENFGTDNDAATEEL